MADEFPIIRAGRLEKAARECPCSMATTNGRIAARGGSIRWGGGLPATTTSRSMSCKKAGSRFLGPCTSTAEDRRAAHGCE